MRKINEIVIHCSATKDNQNISIETIRNWHLDRGFRDVGYHFYIRRDGTIENGRLISKKGAHVAYHNSDTIGICYEGGLDKNGKAKDTRTRQQKYAIVDCIEKNILQVLVKLQSIDHIKIKGHRDYSDDKNQNGKIDYWERMKECPCFDAIIEYSCLVDDYIAAQ